MAGIGSSIISPPRYRPNLERPRSENKRSKIIDVAMRHFAEQGYHAARVGDMAAELGIAKGSIFQHFGSKDGLFFEVYKKAVRSFSRYLDAPAEVRERGFFEVVRYWLERTEHLIREDWIPYRVSFAGKLWNRPCAETRDQPFSSGGRSLRHSCLRSLRHWSADELRSES